VHPNLYGDTKTHFFALWTTDGYKKTICYNHGCPTFVSLNPSEFGLGSVIEKVSTYNGEQVDITIKIRRDKASGNWWLSYGPSGSHRDLIPIGYWKGSIFTGLADNASIILWGGRTSYAENMKGPPMGSGHFSTEGYGKAAGFTDITAIDVDGKYYDPDKMIGFMDRPDCYDISELRKSKFFYGGPAGCSK
ncbi:Neprosin domain-containing protein, partial [Dioscorea alata]